MDKNNPDAQLIAIEEQLMQLSHVEPPQDLRDRVLGIVRTDVQRQQRQTQWAFAAAAAAVLAVGFNFSWSAVQNTDFNMQPRNTQPDLTALAEEIQQIAPELDEREARRQALLLQAGATLPRYPNLSRQDLSYNGD